MSMFETMLPMFMKAMGPQIAAQMTEAMEDFKNVALRVNRMEEKLDRIIALLDEKDGGAHNGKPVILDLIKPADH